MRCVRRLTRFCFLVELLAVLRFFTVFATISVCIGIGVLIFMFWASFLVVIVVVVIVIVSGIVSRVAVDLMMGLIRNS